MPLKESTGQKGSFILFRIKMSIFFRGTIFVIERLVALTEVAFVVVFY